MSATQVRFGPLQRPSMLLGRGPIQVSLVAAALVVAVIAEYTSGLPGLAVTLPVWSLLAAGGLVSVAGRPLVEWAPVVAAWSLRSRLSASTRILAPRRSPGWELRLPGETRPLPIRISRTTGTAYVEDPRTHTLTGLLSLTGHGLLLTGNDTQGALVQGWEGLLASWCRRTDIARLQLIHRSVPSSSRQLQAWWREQVAERDGLPARIVADVLADVDNRARRTECLLAVTFQPPSGRTRDTDAVDRADQRLSSFTDALTGTGVTVHGDSGLSASQLYRAVRTGYDPFSANHIPDTAAPDQHPLVGPVASRESWRHVTTDSACHAVYWVSEWPRSDVTAGFLQPLLLSPDIVRSFTLLATPVGTRRALRDIRRAQVEHTADGTQRARIGQHEDEATRVAGRDLARREQDLVAGHGELAFTGLVTVTATTEADLTAACAATETAAAQAMCELRLLVGQQTTALTAACAPTGRSPW